MHFLVLDSFKEHILLHVLWFQRVEGVCDGCFFCCVCCCNCFLIVGHWKKGMGFWMQLTGQKLKSDFLVEVGLRAQNAI
jgi:hypothetical protein